MSVEHVSWQKNEAKQEREIELVDCSTVTTSEMNPHNPQKLKNENTFAKSQSGRKQIDFLCPINLDSLPA